MYKLRRIVGTNIFSAQFFKNNFHYKKIVYNINPFNATEISHYYQLDQSISVLRVVSMYYSFLLKFLYNFL